MSVPRCHVPTILPIYGILVRGTLFRNLNAESTG
jgi:hypothetical protein